jgi:virginiamycin B lyase
MRIRHLGLVTGLGLAALLLAGERVSAAEPTAALAGRVSSAEEGAMEGVLVSARGAGSTVTVTVVSDAQGSYRFPATRLAPGPYTLAIRAAGYELVGDAATEVAAAGPTSRDLTLRRTEDLGSQLSSGEWLVSMPGSDQQKGTLLNCVGCHQLQLPAMSSHDKTEFVELIKRMQGYANQSTPWHIQKRLAERLREQRGEARERARESQAAFLAGINLSEGETWKYQLKTLPRPKGRATQMIVTEWDLPRETIEPHDVIVAQDGMVWYSNFGEQTIGRLDPRSAAHAEYAVPELKPGWPTGGLGLRDDAQGNLWLGMMYQGGMMRFDPRSATIATWSLPKPLNLDMVQINMVSPRSQAVDGKIWTQNNGYAAVHRWDVATGAVETFEPFKDAAEDEPHNIYDVIPDGQNNAYFTDFLQAHIGRIDAKTGAIRLFKTPTDASRPRRGMMDAQDRLWFAEYGANRIAMFDTKTEAFKEWALPTPWSAPYDVAIDKNGEAWTGSMLNDQIAHLDTRTGDFVEYLLPRPTNIRRVFVDDRTTPVTFWVGSNHGASIVRLEPLD